MCKIVIYGNSGSGKTTLAKVVSAGKGLSHLDLDTIAWSEPGVRANPCDSERALSSFISKHTSWVIEGCYASLISYAARSATKLVFLNIGVEACLENCRSRKWEPHKYQSKDQQDEHLSMLLDWVAEYETRRGEFSLEEHQALYDDFKREKIEINSIKSERYTRFCEIYAL